MGSKEHQEQRPRYVHISNPTMEEAKEVLLWPHREQALHRVQEERNTNQGNHCRSYNSYCRRGRDVGHGEPSGTLCQSPLEENTNGKQTNTLMNIFKTNKEVLVKEYPEIVTQIHNEFNTAGEKLLESANAVLADCQTADKEKGKLLAKLGFTATPQAVEIKGIEATETSAKATSKTVKYFAEKYPLSKFIDEEGVKTICEKYGLVCGGLELFTGFVPKDKLGAIADFKVQELDLQIMVSICTWTMGDHGRKVGDIEKDGGEYGRTLTNTWKVEGEQKLQICAPISDMNTEGYDLKGHKLVKKIPDPVVLQPVKGGYLIVCAWGDEASDELVVNQKMN